MQRRKIWVAESFLGSDAVSGVEAEHTPHEVERERVGVRECRLEALALCDAEHQASGELTESHNVHVKRGCKCSQ